MEEFAGRTLDGATTDGASLGEVWRRGKDPGLSGNTRAAALARGSTIVRSCRRGRSPRVPTEYGFRNPHSQPPCP